MGEQCWPPTPTKGSEGTTLRTWQTETCTYCVLWSLGVVQTLGQQEAHCYVSNNVFGQINTVQYNSEYFPRLGLSYESYHDILLTTMTFCMLLSFRVQEDHPVMSFTVSKNGRLALLNVATQVICFSCYCLISSIALCNCFETTHFSHYGIVFFLGSAPLGPARPGAGQEVPRCDPGLLHNPLLLRRAQWRFHCQW